MGYPTLTYTLTNGTTADATQVMQNFNDLLNGISDGTKDVSINAATIAGTATLNGTVNLGNSSGDDLVVNASLASSIPVKTNNSYDIGGATLAPASIYLGAPSSRSTRLRAHQSLGASNTLIFPNGNGNAGQVLQTDGGGNLSWVNHIPVGVIVAWSPGYFGDGSNGSYTNVLPVANTVASANTYLNPLGWYVCDGSALNDSGSPIFNGASRYLPKLTDSRFLAGATIAGSLTVTSTGTSGVAGDAGASSISIAHVHSGPTVSACISLFDGSESIRCKLATIASTSYDYIFSATGNSVTGGAGSQTQGVECLVSDTGAMTSGATINNRPAYLSCFYIMKVA